ncbi:MAG TPA: hypothetical protein VM554_10875 [Acidisarcina sp.]|nr:hypothetical protein [Acidisarcina sp.]
MHRSPSAALISCALLGAALLASPHRVAAQITLAPLAATGADYQNRWDIFGGFSYSYFSTTIGHGHKTNLYGGGAEGTVWLSPVVGATAAVREVSGHLPVDPNIFGVTNPRMSETLFLFGPEVRLYRAERAAVSAHWLVGGTYGVFDSDLKGISPNTLGLYNNQLAFAMAAGAAWDYNLSPRFSVRAITDFQPTYFGSSVQKEFGGQVGLVYKIGSLKKK